LNLLSNTPTLTLPRQGGGYIYINSLPWREGQGEGGKIAQFRFNFDLSFPQSLSGNPDVVPAKAGNYKRYWIPVLTGNPGCPIENFGHDKKMLH
jgi:hypothetical protein